MPVYVYQVIEEDGGEGEVFEVQQRMSEPPLTTHPETGKRVVRVIQPPMVGGRHSEASVKKNLSPDRLGKLGFTRYQRAGGGFYEKTSGSGPDVLSAND